MGENWLFVKESPNTPLKTDTATFYRAALLPDSLHETRPDFEPAQTKPEDWCNFSERQSISSICPAVSAICSLGMSPTAGLQRRLAKWVLQHNRQGYSTDAMVTSLNWPLKSRHKGKTPPKLQALVCNISPPATAITDYATGLE